MSRESRERKREQPPNVPTPAGAAAVGSTGSERRQLMLAGLQGAVAVIALGISTWTFVQQVGLNADQQVLNSYARERDERKYSSRVAIWSLPSTNSTSYLPAGFNLFIQNRSPVPLRNIQVFAQLSAQQTGGVPLDDIAPCRIERHRIAPPVGTTFARGDDRTDDRHGLWLNFSVDDRRWKLTSDHLDDIKDGDVSVSRLRDYRIDEDGTGTGPVEDCGEGG